MFCFALFPFNFVFMLDFILTECLVAPAHHDFLQATWANFVTLAVSLWVIFVVGSL